MRFDELTLTADDGELRLRFHEQLTVLCGLGADERASFADSLLAALTGGPEHTALRYIDGAGRPVALQGDGGEVTAHLDDGSPVAVPLGTLAPDGAALRSLMLLQADDLGVLDRRNRDDEPEELREARDTLEQLTSELTAARGQADAVATLQRQIDELDEELRAARDGVARREYAQVLARLEAARSELAAVQSSSAAVDADRDLLQHAAEIRQAAARWHATHTRVVELAAATIDHPALDADERDRLSAVPAEPPGELAGLVVRLELARRERDAVDRRLQELSVSRLPAPSDPVVADLGVLEQAPLWRAADELRAAGEAVQRVQMSLGGLELEEIQSATSLIDAIEDAHSELDAADRAVASTQTAGLAGTAAGIAVSLVAIVAGAPVLVPAGLLGAGVAAGLLLVRPRARRTGAAKAEQDALGQADATSYLGFHLRRVEATVDPKLREVVESTVSTQRAATTAWRELAGEVPLDVALALRGEIGSYHEALRHLGETAEEIEALRRQLDDVAEPAVRAASVALAEACAPFAIPDASLGDTAQLAARLDQQIALGAAARAQAVLDDAESEDEEAATRLEEMLVRFGPEAGSLEARLAWFERSVDEAEQREEARTRARPQTDIDAEIAMLDATASTLRRPEWGAVTAAEAANPDIPELEARRAELVAELMAARAEVDLERLADRHAAVERRVAALEVRYGATDANGDPGAIADIQQHLLAHLATAAQAAPHGDAVPVILDDVFARVPADRKWDLLDLLHRLADRHQLVYLSDDAFVAAWARQRALDGTVTLLEPTPEES